MIEAIEKNLRKGTNLLNQISNEQYSDCSVAPYYSSIGCHLRHMLDVFSCIFEGLEDHEIFLNKRNRDKCAETEIKLGLQYIERIIVQLNLLKNNDLDKKVQVKDDMGLGVVNANYTLGAILMQANSHAIHHFASIGYIIYQLGIALPDASFGFNPTTPKKVKV
ncbi:DinB family protein [uncultured Polaribacter sp.]|uniref:DinB family protein n=1 Tax=uncultured Polaribacter sp. TaxID=174711 RepID=UPI00260CA6C7|nr:DinB family protein [uncultured Polaribacter sp.]